MGAGSRRPLSTGLALVSWRQDPRSCSCHLGSRGAHCSRGRSLAMHFPENARGISESCGPPTSPLVLALGSFTPQAGVKDTLSTIRPRNQGPQGMSLLGCQAKKPPGAQSPRCRHLAGCPLPSGQPCSSRPPPSHHGAACLVPCLAGTVTPPQPDCQQYPRQADLRNIFNNVLQMLPACGGRTLPQTQTLKCHLPAPGTAPTPRPVSSGNILGCFPRRHF